MFLVETDLWNEVDVYKNENLDSIAKLTLSSKKRIWWRCKEGHQWECAVSNRTKHGCPYCVGVRAIKGENDIKTLYPELMKEWNYEKNGDINPENLLSVSGKKVWWKCVKGHEWQTKVFVRTKRGHGCPYCSGKRAITGESDLKTLFPKLVEEWDYEKNQDIDPTKIGSTSHKSVWWKCEKGHSYQLVVSKRTTRNDGCPYCSGKRVIAGKTDLATIRPEIAADWDYELNSIKPTEVAEFSHKKVYWKCKKGHSFIRPIADRTSRLAGCPYCSGKKPIVGENDFGYCCPETAKEWNYSKNHGKNPSDYLHYSNAKVWWLCGNGHEWKASINNRAKGKGCPICARKGLRG